MEIIIYPNGVCFDYGECNMHCYERIPKKAFVSLSQDKDVIMDFIGWIRLLKFVDR